jgi:acyl carrier protein
MTSQAEITVLLKEMIEEVSLGERTADSIDDSDTLLGTLGLDSLDYASVVLAVEERLNIKIAEEGVDWPALDTVAALAAFLHGEAARAS